MRAATAVVVGMLVLSAQSAAAQEPPQPEPVTAGSSISARCEDPLAAIRVDLPVSGILARDAAQEVRRDPLDAILVDVFVDPFAAIAPF